MSSHVPGPEDPAYGASDAEPPEGAVDDPFHDGWRIQGEEPDLPVGEAVGAADPEDGDVPAVRLEDGEPEEGEADLESWFAGDWVDVTVLPSGPDPATDDASEAAGLASAARLLWQRAHPDAVPPGDGPVALLRAVVDTGADELDQRAARVLLGLLGERPA